MSFFLFSKKVLKFCVEKEGVEMEIIKNKNFLFFNLNNREYYVKNSGLEEIKNLLFQRFDDPKNCISTNLKHKLVLDQIDSLSKKNTKNNCILDVSLLKKSISELNNEDTFEDINENITQVLCDLNDLGLIIFFDREMLKNTIITDPKWFNDILKSILDYGRKKTEIMIELICTITKEKIEELRNNETLSNKFKSLSEKLSYYIKDQIKGSPNERHSIRDIWDDDNLKKSSNVDKISFFSLIEYLKNTLQTMSEFGDGDILNYLKRENGIDVNQDLFQIFHKVEESLLINDAFRDIFQFETISKDDKKEFLIKLLTEFEFILPIERRKYEKLFFGKIKRIQHYLIPILFPLYKPQKIFIEKKEYQLYNSNNEWQVDYMMTFKPSSFWKTIFLGLRRCCIENVEDQMVEEVYWKDGLLFYFKKEKIGSCLILVEIKEIENVENFSNSISITMKTEENPEPLFHLIHQTMKDFVSKWIHFMPANKIHFTLFKKAIEVEKPSQLLSVENEKDLEQKRVICSFCGIEFSFSFITSHCSNCMSKYFLIEKQYCLLKVVAEGGFGRVYKALDLKSNQIFAIKERLSESEMRKSLWYHEISLLQKINQVCEDLVTPRIVNVLDDTPRNLKEKFFVMECNEFLNPPFFFTIFI